jgi:hypothetical protein
MGKGARQSVTGVIVNQTLGLSRQERRRLRACVYQLSLRSTTGDQFQKRERLQGKLAYLAMLNPQQAASIESKLS